MKTLAASAMLLCLAVGAASADDDPPDWVFCTKPCTPSETTRRTLNRDELHAGMVCKRGSDLVVDAKRRLVVCTTARPTDLGGLPIAGDAYTIFHANGRIYQTSTRAPAERTTAAGLEVPCATGAIVLDPDGLLESCTLLRAIQTSPTLQIGHSIELHRGGQLAGGTIADPLRVGAITFPAGTIIRWTPTKIVAGGHLDAALRVGGIAIQGDFTLHPDGALHDVELGEPATIAGMTFPVRAKISRRSDGTLETAEFISKEGFMIHGEPWHDTTHQIFDRDGRLVSSTVTHWQSNSRPPKFR